MAAHGTSRRSGRVRSQEQRYEDPYWEAGPGDVTRWVEDLDLPVAPLRDPQLVDLVRGVGGWKWGETPDIHGHYRADDYARWEALKADIAANGITDPITVAVEPDGRITILDGTHRLKAVEEMGWTTIPADLRYFGGSERYWLWDHAEPRPPDSYTAYPESGTQPVEVSIDPEVMW